VTSVLVTDGDERAALAVVRSLGRAGYEVHVCGSRRRTMAAMSRRTFESFAAPDPLHAPADFVAAVSAYAASHEIRVLLPITEAALLAVLGARARFTGMIIPFPPLETFRAASDKQALTAMAGRVGIAVPRQWEVVHPGGLAAIDLDGLPYPVVLKPARSVGEDNGVRSRQTVSYAGDADALRRRVAHMPAAAFPLLVQQRIVGPGCGVFLLRWGGATIAVFAHRRIREKPPAGGVSVYAEAVVADPALVAQSERLLAELDWQGIAMVEYKRDASTGVPYLMEINGRFWGSLQLAIDAGVDFPRWLVRCALGEPLPQPPSYRAGVRGGWWWGEVDHILTRLRRSDAELALPPGAPTRASAVAGFLARCRPGQRDAVFRLDDPMPFVLESARWLRRR
jgi:predicted ATP-grasp superfamily ATP-dependent carboligase